MAIGEHVIQVHSKLLKIDAPHWAAVWQIPFGVRILTADAQADEWVLIVDVTRVATWGLIGWSVIFGLIGLLVGKRRS